MQVTEINIDTLTRAANRLACSDRGTQAMRDLLTLMNHGGATLDVNNQVALLTLLRGYWEGHGTTTFHAIEDSLGGGPDVAGILRGAERFGELERTGK